jgi:hypothetical protein
MSQALRDFGSLAACVVLAACGGEGGGSWAGTVEDSAGVTIVRNPAQGIWSEGDAPVLEEDLRIGTAEGDPLYQFASIAGVDIDGSGRIHVLDQQGFRVRVYDAQGKHVMDVGHQGTGPGELSQFTAGVFVLPGDTVMVVDAGQARLTRFAPDGTSLGSTPTPEAMLPLRWDRAPDGRIVQQARLGVMPGSTEQKRDLLIVRGTSGAINDTIMELPVGGTIDLSGNSQAIRLFESEPIWTIMGDGRVAFGMNSDYRIRLHTGEGQLERVITMPFTREPVTETDRTELLNLIREAWTQAGLPPQAVDRVSSMVQFADHYPAFASLLGGPEGTLWVQHIRTARQVKESGEEFDVQNVGAQDWDVFDAEGRFLGEATMPDRFQPLRVHGSHLYGVWRDELDVPYVMRLHVSGLAS